MWDHKPPAIYYVNALGLLLAGRSAWGVWLLEVVALYTAAILCFRLLLRPFGGLAAALGVATLLFSVGPLLWGSNFPEEYSLPAQIGLLLLFMRLGANGPAFRIGLGMGLLTAVCFLFKPNLTGIGISVVIYLLLQLRNSSDRRWALLAVVGMATGAGGLFFAVGLYFAARGALPDLWAQVFVYNSVYTIATYQERLDAITHGLYLLLLSGVTPLAFAGWIRCLRGLLRRELVGRLEARLYLLATIAFPVELGMTALSARLYSHYYLALLPISALMLAILFAGLVEAAQNWAIRLKALPALVVTLLVLPQGFVYWSVLSYQLGLGSQSPATYQTTYRTAADYISAHTHDGDLLLMWGTEASINFATGRDAPTRFVYQTPLCQFTHDASASTTLLREIKANPPALIVDASSDVEGEIIPPLDARARAEWAKSHTSCGPPNSLDNLFDYVTEYYESRGRIEPEGWTAYARK